MLLNGALRAFGHPAWGERHMSWDGIYNLYNKGAHPWVVLEEFNGILYSSEKEGDNARTITMMKVFHDCLMKCGLEDLGFFGDPFTGENETLGKDLTGQFVMLSGQINFLVLQLSMRNMCTRTIVP